MNEAPQEVKSPEETFNGDHLPDDLKWIMSHFGLPKNDPMVVLMAWHWKKVQGGKDTLEDGYHKFRALLDTRSEALSELLTKLDTANARLAILDAALSNKSLGLTQRIETELRKPIQESVTACREMVGILDKTARRFTPVQERNIQLQIRAGFYAGLVVGFLFFLCISLASSGP